MDILKTKKSSRLHHNQPVAVKKRVPKGTDQDVYSLEFDGASKGNPGKAGAGAILKRPDGTVLCEITKGVGIATSNFAEYRALILGLQTALDQGIHHIKAQGDSKLVCSQVMGKWQVRSENLSTCFAEAMELKKRFQSFSIHHVYREFNSAADALANSAVLLAEDKPPNCCNRSPDLQTTATSPSKSTPRKHKGAEDASTTMKACKQTNLSLVNQEEKQKFYHMDYHGASSAKNGKAGVGALLYSPDGSLCFEIKQGLGVATRNVAHYQALVIGLRAVLECNVSHVVIQGDALLIFKQITGQVKVKDESLVALWKEANALLTRFTAFSITHVDKCKNSAACALAEVAVHSHGSDPDYLKTSGTADIHVCVVSVQSQNSSSRIMIPNEITSSMGSPSIARKKLMVAAGIPQGYKPCRGLLCPFYCQVSQVLRTKATQPLPFTAVMSKCLPLYAANTSIHKLLLPSKRLRCIPHIFQSSLMHIAGVMRQSAFSSLSFR